MTTHATALAHSPALPWLIAGLGAAAVRWVVWDWRRGWDR